MFKNVSDIKGKKFCIAELVPEDYLLMSQFINLISTFGGLYGHPFATSDWLEFDYYIYGHGVMESAARTHVRKYKVTFISLVVAVEALEKLEKSIPKGDDETILTIQHGSSCEPIVIRGKFLDLDTVREMFEQHPRNPAVLSEQVSIYSKSEDANIQTTKFEFLNEEQVRTFIESNLKSIDPILLLTMADHCFPVTINNVLYWEKSGLQAWLKSIHRESEPKVS